MAIRVFLRKHYTLYYGILLHLVYKLKFEAIEKYVTQSLGLVPTQYKFGNNDLHTSIRRCQ